MQPSPLSVDPLQWEALFFEVGTMGCVLVDPASLKFVRVNERFARMLGYTVDEVTKLTWSEVTHPEDRGSNRALIGEVLRGARPNFVVRKHYLHRYGHAVQADVEVRPLRDTRGEVALLVATVDDASDDVRRLEELVRERLHYLLLSNTSRALTRGRSKAELSSALVETIELTLGSMVKRVEVWERREVASSTEPADPAVGALRELLGPLLSAGSEAESVERKPVSASLSIDERAGSAQATLAAAGARRALGYSIRVETGSTVALLLGLAERESRPSLEVTFSTITEELAHSFRRCLLEDERYRIASEFALAVQALEASPVVLYRASFAPGFPITYLSANAERFGLDIEAIRSGEVGFLDLVHPEDRARVEDEAAAMFASEARGGVQRYRLRFSNGTVMDVEDAFRLTEPAEDGAQTVEGVMRNVTPHATAERALAESEAKYHQLFDLSPLPMWVFDAETLRFLEVNQAAIDHYGYSREEFLALRILDIHPPGDEARLLASVGSVPDTFDHAGVWQHQKRDGTLLWVEITSHALVFAGRAAELVLANDVTDRQRSKLLADDAIRNLERTLLGTVNAVAHMVEARDPYTAGHERRVAELSVAFGREMGLDEHRLEGLRIGGYVHDVGKIAVPAEILAKPTRLSKMEFEIIKAHAERGFAILEPISFPWPVAEMARQHHERMDGSGYPQGLRGEAILLEARILAVADVVESMASDRPYRAGLGLAAALEEIEKNRGRLYDPQVADACLRLFRSGSLQLPR